MFGRVAKTAITTKTGRKATRTVVGTKTGRKAIKAGAKAAAKAGKGVGKGGGIAALLGGKGAGKVALTGGKGQAKLAEKVIASRKPSGGRLLRYGFFAVLGFAVGALVARAGGKEGAESSFTGGTGHDHPDPGSPAGRRGETWGSGTPLGTSGPAGGPPPPPPAGGPPPPPPPGGPAHQRPGEPHRTGAERDFSDPASGPLIGKHHGAGAGDIPEQQEEVEQRIRTRVGEDPRTLGMQRLNVEVNDGVAEIRGVAPSEDAKAAVEDIASNTEGVREVVILLTVGG